MVNEGIGSIRLRYEGAGAGDVCALAEPEPAI
jgi:hypothetical protein